MAKTNDFHVKKYENEESRITVEEERKKHSAFVWFLINNGRLIFIIALLLSFSIFVGAAFLTLTNLKGSEIAYYETNGVVVEFDGSDNSILNGLPITKDYANRLFNSSISSNEKLKGAVIKIKESKFSGGVIVFYSDKTALVKYDDGSYMRVFPVSEEYGISEDGIINAKADTRMVTGEYKNNDKLGITILYLSDGTVEITKDNVTFFLRDTNFTSTDSKFYTNLSIISVPIKNEDGKIYYSNGVIKEGNFIIVNGENYSIKEEKNIHDGIRIIYYENGYAEIIKDGLSIMVEKSEHIVYDDNILEIIDNSDSNEKMDIKDLMDIKDITLTNSNNSEVDYVVVLEESNNYDKYGVGKRLANQYIHFNVFTNGEITNGILDNNVRNSDMFKKNSTNNVYLLHTGMLRARETLSLKLGMWIDYDTITNEYMNSALVGTIKVYAQSLD